MEKSDSINDLAAALSKAQGEMNAAEKDAKNPFYKSSYATLASVIYASKEPLSKNGLSFIQAPKITGTQTTLETIIMHASGQWVKSEYPVNPVKNDPQSLGSALSYAKRYAIQAMLGIPSADDDAESGTGRGDKDTDKPSLNDRTQNEKNTNTNPAAPTQPQIKRLYAICHESNWTEENLKTHMKKVLNIESVKDLTWLQYDNLCKVIQATPKLKEQSADR